MDETRNTLLSEKDQARLAAAIGRAETGTAGEIRVLVSTRPLIDHALYGLQWAGAAALLAPWPLALLLPVTVAQMLALQGLVLVVLGSVLVFTPLGRRCIPAAVERAAARHAALYHFLGLGIHQTRQRTGVLIFIAVPEHRVEVVADEAIHARVGTAAWEAVCARVLAEAGEGRLVEGIEAAVAEAGRLLVAHVPSDVPSGDELPDRIVLL